MSSLRGTPPVDTQGLPRDVIVTMSKSDELSGQLRKQPTRRAHTRGIKPKSQSLAR
jgi:hypothetical protein